eukprot:Gb_02545 [translate_table: standard]
MAAPISCLGFRGSRLKSHDVTSMHFQAALNINLGTTSSTQRYPSYGLYLERMFKRPLVFNGSRGLKIRGNGSSFFGWILLMKGKPTACSRNSHKKRVYCCFSELQGQEAEGIREQIVPARWDVVGLGQAMVDFSGMVEDGFLEKLGLEKGIRRVVGHEERGKVLRAMDGCSFKAAAGGSLSNTLVALARLGMGSNEFPALNVAMTGSVGSDPLGHFYRAKLQRASVNFLSNPIDDGTTGTVIVLTTPDAQRTMLSYQGMSSIVNFDSFLADIISKSRILVVEGYLCELPQTVEAIAQACEAAHSNGVLVALTASDVSCVLRHHKLFWDIMVEHADILFANSDEARAFCGFSSSVSPALATRHLSQYCPLVSVTDGASGSYIGLKGEVIYIPPSPSVPVDTCGAGDAYAAGILYGLLRGMSDLKGMGNLAARVAAVVVGQRGTRLKEIDSVELAEYFSRAALSEDQTSDEMSVYIDIEPDHISSI